MAGLYDNLRTLALPLNVHKSRVTSAFGLIGGQTIAGPGNEGVDLTTWINERIASGDINVAAIAGGYANVQEDGNPVTNRDTINFVGAGVTASDLGGVTTVTIPGGSSYTDEQAQDAIGLIFNTTLSYDDATPTIGRAAITGDVGVPAGSNVSTIVNDVVTNAKLANMAGNTVKVNNTASPGDPVDLVLPASTMLGRGSAGNIVPVTIGSGLSISAGGELTASASGSGISEVEVGTTLIRYVILTGTPVFSANISSGVQTITASGGTYKLVSVATTGATANLAGDNSFTIVYNGVPGTTLIAYPDVSKWNLSGSAPSSGVPDIQMITTSPQHQVIGAVPGTSVTIKLPGMNIYTNWCIKSIW